MSYAEAIVNTAAAIARANKDYSYPASLSVMAAAAAAGATQVAAITSTEFKGYAGGGYVTGAGTSTSDSINARLSNREFVVNAEATARNRSLLEYVNTVGRTSSINNTYYGDYSNSGKRQNVIINNYSNSQVETRSNENGDLEVRILALVDAKIASDLSQGPESSKTSKAIHGLNKRGY